MARNIRRLAGLWLKYGSAFGLLVGSHISAYESGQIFVGGNAEAACAAAVSLPDREGASRLGPLFRTVLSLLLETKRQTDSKKMNPPRCVPDLLTVLCARADSGGVALRSKVSAILGLFLEGAPSIRLR